jgi:hypothetical protein
VILDIGDTVRPLIIPEIGKIWGTPQIELKNELFYLIFGCSIANNSCVGNLADWNNCITVWPYTWVVPMDKVEAAPILSGVGRAWASATGTLCSQ